MPVIKVEDIAHVRFAAPDLAMMRGFLEDFGLSCFEESGRLYGKGSDGRPFVHVTEKGEARFMGVGLRAASIADLEALAAHEGLTPEPLNEPGGGMVLRLTDPDERIGYPRIGAGNRSLDLHPHLCGHGCGEIMLVGEVVEKASLGDPCADDKIVDRNGIDRTIDQQVQSGSNQGRAGALRAGRGG